MPDGAQSDDTAPQAGVSEGGFADMGEAQIGASGRLFGLLDHAEHGVGAAMQDLDRELVRRFLAEFESTLDDRQVDEREGGRLVAQLVETFRLIERRKAKQVLVSTHNVRELRESAGEEDFEHTMLEVCMREQPFIVDTIELCLSLLGLRVSHRQTTTLAVLRDSAGRLTSIDDRDAEGARPEVIARFELEEALDEEERKNLETDVLHRLQVAQHVVRHFKRMKGSLRELARTYKRVVSAGKDGDVETGVLAESRALLDWLLDENFVFLGLSRYSVDPGEMPEAVEGGGAGDEDVPSFWGGRRQPNLQLSELCLF